MENKPSLVIRRHELTHIGSLAVDQALFDARFDRGCSMANCDAGCCAGGVWVDLEHRDVILAHTEVIARHMTADQERDPAQWFDGEVVDDPDFPSGKAIGTQEDGARCVFLNSHRRCVLHQVDDVERLGVVLKPFYCRVFPVTVSQGLLTLDDPIAGQRRQCCSRVADGGQTVFEVCPAELETVLGSEGVAELRSIVREDPARGAAR